MGTTVLIASGISLLLVVVGVLFFIGAFWAWRNWSNFIQHMVIVEGHIANLSSQEVVHSNERGISYSVTYHYEYEGQPYVQDSSISRKHFQEWKRGMKITVRLPSNKPGEGSLVAEASLLGDTALIWGFGLAGLVCFGFALLAFVLMTS